MVMLLLATFFGASLQPVTQKNNGDNMSERKICFTCKKIRVIYDPEGEMCDHCLNRAKMSFASWKKYRQKKATEHSIY